MTELKRCPFCKGNHMKKIFCTGETQGDAYRCEDCKAAGPVAEPGKAADAWNRRATGWIAVEDGLPENIISWNNGHKESLPLLGYCPEIYPRMRRVIYYPERTGVYESHWRLEEQKHTRDSVKVTHWQPLPSPPEEKK